MDQLDDGQIELKVHGLDHLNESEVPATVFAAELRALVKVLKAEDEIANGKVIHQYAVGRDLAPMFVSKRTGNGMFHGPAPAVAERGEPRYRSIGALKCV